MKNMILYFFLLFFVCQVSVQGAEKVILATNNYPPYQIKKAGKITGLSIDILNCVFRNLKREYTVQVTPWKRARIETETGRINGYFTVMQDASMKNKAVFSAPLILEKWYWIYRKDIANNKNINKVLKKIPVGAISGSNEEKWLTANHYNLATNAKTTSQLLLQLKMKRISAFVADERAADEMLASKSEKNDSLSRKFIKYTPLGVYFSKKFIQKNPGFMKEFNKAVFPCVTDTIKLSKNERNALKKIARNVKKWSGQPVVIQAIKKQNHSHSNINSNTIQKLDRQWRDEKKTGNYSLIQKTLSNKISRYLKKIQKDSHGLYSEIFVMDRFGLNVGQSEITSDYWQGDEKKFKKTYGTGKNMLFIDEIEYDESSKTFQSQVNMSILDPSNHKLIGAITVGVDVEAAQLQH